MGDKRTRDDAGEVRASGRLRGRRRPDAPPPDADGGTSASEPVTVEQLIARQGGQVGRRRAARTGEIPLPLVAGERTPEHRRGRPPVPEATPAAGAGAQPTSGPVVRTAYGRRADDTPAPQRGLPPVPGGPADRGSASPATPAVAPQAGEPATPEPPRSGLPPVPPSARPSVPLFPPLDDRTGHRPSRPIAPLPPIPGRDTPLSGATRLAPPSPRERRAARRAVRSPGRRRLVRAAIALAALVGLVLAYHLGLYFYVDQRIERVEALTPQGAEVLAPALQDGSVTYLVVGTGLPGEEGPASVATLLAHVSADEQRAVLVSIPPTALVDTPACIRADGQVREAATESFAASLLEGGPSCTVRAVQQLSGLRVDHYLGVDLARLPGMVDALGGVAVCLPRTTPAVAASAEPLPAGASELSGERASGYLAPGDAGADVTGEAVAERAQVVLTSTLRAAMSAGTLGNPATLTRFLTRASDALTVDEATTLGDLRALAGTFGDLSGDAVQRIGLPVARVGYVPAGSEQAHVVLDDAATRSLFDEVIREGRLPAGLVAPGTADPAVAAAPAPAAAEQPVTTPAEQPLTAAPAGITVDVLNGTATSGLAATVADQLRAQAFGVGQVGNEPGVVNETVVRYPAGAEEQARTVAAAVPGAVLQPSDATSGGLQLVLGPGFSSVVPVVVPPPAPVAAPETPTAAAPGTPSAGPATSGSPATCA